MANPIIYREIRVDQKLIDKRLRKYCDGLLRRQRVSIASQWNVSIFHSRHFGDLTMHKHSGIGCSTLAICISLALLILILTPGPRVNPSVAPSEFGRAGGVIVQSSIKSGTNQFHGSAFEFARSSLFDASPNYRFQGASVAPVLPFKRNTFGGSIGGPILRNRLFIF